MANTVKILPDGRVQKLFDIPGAAGVGIPFGGDAGQVLTKVSGEDFFICVFKVHVPPLCCIGTSLQKFVLQKVRTLCFSDNIE